MQAEGRCLSILLRSLLVQCHRTPAVPPQRQKRATWGCLVLGPSSLCPLSPEGNMLEVTSVFLAYFSLCCFPKPCKREGESSADSCLSEKDITPTCYLCNAELYLKLQGSSCSDQQSACSEHLAFPCHTQGSEHSLAWVFLLCWAERCCLTLQVPWRYGKVSTINFPECWRNEAGPCKTGAGSL